jgi:hypothetical protein
LWRLTDAGAHGAGGGRGPRALDSFREAPRKRAKTCRGRETGGAASATASSEERLSDTGDDEAVSYAKREELAASSARTGPCTSLHTLGVTLGSEMPLGTARTGTSVASFKRHTQVHACAEKALDDAKKRRVGAV